MMKYKCEASHEALTEEQTKLSKDRMRQKRMTELPSAYL